VAERSKWRAFDRCEPFFELGVYFGWGWERRRQVRWYGNGCFDLRSGSRLADEAVKQTGLFDRFDQVRLDSQLQFDGTKDNQYIPAAMARICFYSGSSFGASPEYATAAAVLATACPRRGLGIVYGGSSAGLMGVLADAALAAGGEVIESSRAR
jgi:hypothetical protein